MAARRPFWKWHRWKSIGFCLWPPSTCIWNLKLKFQSKLDLCSGNHAVYRQTDGRTDRRTDGRTDKVNPVYPPSNFVGRGYNYMTFLKTPENIISTLFINYTSETIWQIHKDNVTKLTIRCLFLPSGIVVACVCSRVCLSVCKSRACPRNYSWAVQARIIKFGRNVQNTLAKVPVALGAIDLTFKVKFIFKVKFHPKLSLKFFHV